MSFLSVIPSLSSFRLGSLSPLHFHLGFCFSFLHCCAAFTAILFIVVVVGVTDKFQLKNKKINLSFFYCFFSFFFIFYYILIILFYFSNHTMKLLQFANTLFNKRGVFIPDHLRKQDEIFKRLFKFLFGWVNIFDGKRSCNLLG